MTPTTVKFHKGEGSLELAYSDDSHFTLSLLRLQLHLILIDNGFTITIIT